MFCCHSMPRIRKRHITASSMTHPYIITLPARFNASPWLATTNSDHEYSPTKCKLYKSLWKFRNSFRYILSKFRAFWATDRLGPSAGFAATRKYETGKLHKVTDWLYFIYLGEFPTKLNLTKLGMQIGVLGIINRTKFGNNRSKEYKVTDGRISHRNGLSPITL